MRNILLPALLVVLNSAAEPAGTRLLRQPTISKDRVAFVYGGDLWIAQRSGGMARRLTSTAEPESGPRFSPDGRSLAFVRAGDVYVVTTDGGAERRLTYHPSSDRVLEWTADGHKLLLASDRFRGDLTGSPSLFLLALEGGLPEPLPAPRAAHGSLSPDGSRVAYGPNPEITLWAPFKRYRGGSVGYIAIYDHTRNTLQELPRTPANDVYPMWHGNTIYFASDRDGVMNLFRFDLHSRATERLTSHAEWDVRFPSRGPDGIVYENGGWLYTLDFNSSAVRQLPIEVPAEAGAPTQDGDTWQQALREVWSKYAERGFQPPPRWQTVQPRYAELMKWAAHRADAEYVLFEMLAEAGRSHASIRWAGAMQKPETAAVLGADYRAKDGHYQIAKIYAGGPLAAAEAGVREGDLVRAVEGEPLVSTDDIHARLIGRAGKLTRLSLSDASGVAREVSVTPVAEESRIRYTEWVRTNRVRVAESTNGKVGYVHIPNVDPPGVDEFRKQWKDLRGKVTAVIVDVRNNSGGRNPEDIYSWIGNRPDRVMYDFRGRVPPFGVDLDGPKVMIANDQSVSGGDELPYFFKHYRMGRLLGTRTFGGMIGAGATYKIPGGWVLSFPEYAFYSPVTREWYPENRGVEPDETVELRPLALTGGREPQLERAIQVALEMLKTWQRRPEPPPYEMAAPH